MPSGQGKLSGKQLQVLMAGAWVVYVEIVEIGDMETIRSAADSMASEAGSPQQDPGLQQALRNCSQKEIMALTGFAQWI